MLKRIARYLRAQDWNAIAVEFLIVTAGVLMGIQVSNWNSDRLDRERAGQQLAGLRAELAGNLEIIRRYQQGVQSQLGDVDALERALDGNDEPQIATDRKLMNVFRIRSMILETAAFDELRESGNWRHVAPDIRSAMTEWQSLKGRVARVDQDALSYRASAIDSLSATLAFDPMIQTLATTFRPAGNPPVRNDPARLARDPKVRNFLAIRYGIETQKLQYAAELERATKGLLALLDDGD